MLNASYWTPKTVVNMTVDRIENLRLQSFISVNFLVINHTKENNIKLNRIQGKGKQNKIQALTEKNNSHNVRKLYINNLTNAKCCIGSPFGCALDSTTCMSWFLANSQQWSMLKHIIFLVLKIISTAPHRLLLKLSKPLPHGAGLTFKPLRHRWALK